MARAVLHRGPAASAAGDEPQAQHQTVDDDYFRAIGVPLLKGRFFDPRDTVDAPGVVIVNDALARRQWPNEDPIGQSDHDLDPRHRSDGRGR